MDLRSMVPVLYDVGRRKTKVWMFLGWSRRSMEASFARPPRVEVLGDVRRLAACSTATSSCPL